MNRKKAICLSSMASNLDNFNRINVRILQSLGYDVTLAANFNSSEDYISKEKVDLFISEMESQNVQIVQIDFSRHIGNVKKQIRSYFQVKDLLSQKFDLVHCHTPICAAITRLCAKKHRKNGTKVFYTAHGFHFYKGAPIANWIIYYPVEKMLSKYTDVLITINKEDYERAANKFNAMKTVYIPGIGVDTERFVPEMTGRKKIREELGIGNDSTVVLSVGELNDNKNHKAVIRAIKGLECVYVIVGKGVNKDNLLAEAKDNQVDVRLVGYRSDVADFYRAADLYVLPSIREGLNVSLMEAMSTGLPVACSRIRGNTDLVDEPLFNPKDPEDIRHAIEFALDHKESLGKNNRLKIKQFDISVITGLMENIYNNK